MSRTAAARWLLVLACSSVLGATALFGAGLIPARAAPARGGDHARIPIAWRSGSSEPQREELGSAAVVSECAALAAKATLSVPELARLLRCHCSGEFRVPLDDLHRHVRRASGQGAPVELQLDREYALCIAGVLTASPDALDAKAWGGVLAEAGARAKGGLLQADARLIEIAGELVSRYQDDREWWERLWAGFPETGGAIHARRAVFEAVAARRPLEARESMWRMLATLEDPERSPRANVGLAALGLTIRDHGGLGGLAAWKNSNERNWRRVVLHSLADSDLWPARLSEPEADSLRAVLDLLRTRAPEPAIRYLKFDAISRSWALLGPRLAATEFREYCVAPTGDFRESAWRAAAAAKAVAEHGSMDDADVHAALDDVDRTLRRLFTSGHYDLDRLVAAILDSRQADSREARDVLIRALGKGVFELSNSVRQRLMH